MTTYTVTATATDAATDRITVSSATNMFSGMPIVFSGTAFGGITAGATYYIGTIVPDYPTSTITVTSLPGGAVVGLTTATGTMTGTFSSGGQQIIDIGSAPNDGTGDPLRTAFNDTNLNFDQVFAAGPVGSNIQIANNTIKTINTNGNLVLAPNGTGMVKSNVNIVPDQTQIRNLGAPTLRWDTVYSYNYSGNGSGLTGIVSTANIGTASKLINQFSEVNIPVASGNIYANVNSVNITTTTPDGVLVTGNVTAGNALISANIVANGQIQSNTGFFTSGYLSATGSTILANTTVTGNLSVAGNVTGNLSATGNITGNYFVGNGSSLSNVAVSKIANGNSYANIATANGNVVISANVSRWTFATTGNLVLPGNTFAVNYANGNPVIVGSGGNAGLPLANGTSNFNIATTNGNATVTANSLSTWTFGTNGNLTLPGNGEISINYANGDPYGGTGGGTYGNSDVATLLAAFGSNTISSTGNITTTANVSGGFILGNVAFANGISTYGNANVVANLAALGSNPVSTAGNVTGAYILGNGSALTNLPAPTVTQDITSNGAMSIMTYDGVIKYVNYATVEPSSGNIASGNITTTGLVSATGNITAGNLNSPTLNNSGNISVVAGSNAWIFGSTGNLTLPANTFSVNYANGNAVTFSGGSGNTGNVTFDDQAVVGTGDQVGSSGLYLAPGTESVGNLQYLRVRGGDVATHIHLDTGNNAYFDQYFGDDGKYVKLANTGNIVINSNDAVGNSASWTFGTDGNLTIPGGGSINTVGTGTAGITANITSGNAYLGLDDTSSTATLYGNAGVQIGTHANVGWNFDAAGNLTAPGNISAVGNVTGGNLTTAGLATVTGNITGGNLNTGAQVVATGNITGGNVLTGGIVSVTGNVTGGNVLTSGLISATGNIFANNLGNISSLNLNGNASAVLYGNGIFAAVAGGSSTVNTGYNVGANTVVLAGAIKVRYNGMGDIELQATSGTIGAYWAGQYITATTSTTLESSHSLNTSVWWAIGANVGSTGDTITITLMDTTNGKIYRVTTIITPTGNCGSIIIETLI